MRALVTWVVGSLLLTTGSYAGAAVLEDTDGDGLADTAAVGDWDGDGVLEMEDIQQALTALTDPGMKVVRLEPGRFLAPQFTAHRWGVVELPSNVVLEGSGRDTILEGITGDCDSASCLNQVAVVANADIEASGNFRIVVRDLQIDGRAPEPYAGAYTPSRPGVRFTGTRDVLVENVLVHHAYHACLYTSDSRDVAFVGNEVHDCGGFERIDPAASGYPGVYVFANLRPVLRVRIVGNLIGRTGETAVSFRKAPRSPLPSIDDVLLADNEIHDTVGVRTTSRCWNTSGTNGLSALGNVCRNTAGVQVTAADAYFDKATSVNAARRLVVDDLLLEGTHGGHPLEIGWNLDNAIFHDIRVLGSDPGAPCVALFDPIRSVSLDGLLLDECGGPGIRTQTIPGMGTIGNGFRLGDVLRFRDVRVIRRAPWEGGSYPAMQFLDDSNGLRVDGLRVSGPFSAPYRFEGVVYGAMIRICPYDDPSGPCTIDRY